MGKGIDFLIILELLFYVSASLIPLALPLAILISSLMTFGNFSENNELTALKSSGLSLHKIMRPLLVFVVGISIFTFYFSNYVIPVANLKWHSLIFDIQNTKITNLIKPGVFTNEIDGYAIKVGSGKNGTYKDVIIHQFTNPRELKTIKAKQIGIYRSTNSSHLFFELTDGRIFEELDIQNPIFLPNGKIQNVIHTNRPSRYSRFDKATYKVNVSGFKLNRSDNDIYKDKYEMLNVFQIKNAMDSLEAKRIKMNEAYRIVNMRDQPIFNSKNIQTMKDTIQTKGLVSILNKDISQNDREKINKRLISKLKSKNQNLENQINFLNTIELEAKNYWIEFHRKFSLSVTLVILFFMGASLGSIIKKGGFGAPVIIAAIIFFVYFSIITTGENLAQSQVISPFLGMWMACIIFTPVAILLTRAAARDSNIFSSEVWTGWFRKSNKQ